MEAGHLAGNRRWDASQKVGGERQEAGNSCYEVRGQRGEPAGWQRCQQGRTRACHGNLLSGLQQWGGTRAFEENQVAGLQQWGGMKACKGNRVAGLRQLWPGTGEQMEYGPYLRLGLGTLTLHNFMC